MKSNEDSQIFTPFVRSILSWKGTEGPCMATLHPHICALKPDQRTLLRQRNCTSLSGKTRNVLKDLGVRFGLLSNATDIPNYPETSFRGPLKFQVTSVDSLRSRVKTNRREKSCREILKGGKHQNKPSAP